MSTIPLVLSLIAAACGIPRQQPELAGETAIHSVTDISHEFTFYFDGRFARNYVLPLGGADARNWASLHACELENVNLLVLQSGASPCPYPPRDRAVVRAFLEAGGGALVG